MSESDTIDVGDALETLVHQFSDPWSFLRELIQNALDAGSREIDVNIEHEASEEADDPGLMLVEVIDTGEGMDRKIIDTRLTRLFSSAKDGDYTKIGRFGIGFVSVFAIEPDLVCVDTGRTGEYWRVLFRKDRSFQRIVLDTPVEGTTIRIYKRGGPAEVEEARARARQVLEYWCKHARAEIRCDDELISRPLQLDAHCVVEHEEEGTRVQLGYASEAGALRGYYHAGLTLYEEHGEGQQREGETLDPALAHVTFKVDSRYLEHTLTRDNVLRDENFAKAMQIVARLAQDELPVALGVELARLTALGEDGDTIEFLRARLYALVSAEQEPPRAIFDAAIVPVVDANDERELISLAAARKRSRRSYVASVPSPVTAALCSRGDTVLLYRENSWLGHVLTSYCKRRPTPVTSVCTALEAEGIEVEQWSYLRAALLELLGSKAASDVRLGHLAYPESPVADHVAITQAKFAELTTLDEIGELSSGWFSAKRIVVLNADHPTVVNLLEVAHREPEFAAYMLLKLFFLRSALTPERDAALATQAAEARWRRSTT